MKNLRDHVAAISACGLMVCGAAGAQVSSAPATAAVVATAPAAVPDMAAARVFVLEDMPARKTVTGGESRDSLKGTLVTGEAVSVHESVLPVGAVPSPLHKIQHSEVVSVLDGMVEFQHDGKAERVGPGGVIYVAFGTVHAMKNVEVFRRATWWWRSAEMLSGKPFEKKSAHGDAVSSFPSLD